MRKIVFLALIFLALCAFNVAAAATTTCSDPDESGDPEDSIGDIATVKYGLTDKTDECVSGKDGYRIETGNWVREYYCANVSGVVQRTSKEFDCLRYGYTKCESGRCTGKDGSSTSSTPKPAAKPQCGDRILQKDRGEQCEPPDAVCYLGTSIGVCTRANAQGLGGCQCKLYSGSTAEETPTPEETVSPTPAKNETPEVTEAPEKTEEPAPTVTETREPLPEDLAQSNGIGVTRAITNSVKQFFRWMGSWFD